MSTNTIDTTTQGMTIDQLRAALAAEQARNRALTAHVSSNRLSFRVSEKGACSVYGLGRFPVTLYREQWERLEAAMPELKAFIIENKAKLTVKERVKAAAAV